MMLVLLILFLVSEYSKCVIYQFANINDYNVSKSSCDQHISFSTSINIWIFKIVLRTIEMAILITAIYPIYKFNFKADQYFIQYEIFWRTL